ncbi:MAG TPA: hypothetical protein PLZ53_04745 [Candidatus Hydrogenedentes bacterium]|jgi:hypothetical protein|nr:MAG: hypothetical protein BWY07_00507 [Candidatus Hydrogenedentes bacterium ADurb.Bin170]HNZ49094.1 hypothetical protein [Candidatus Hydrogenedentota bacterium]HOD94953.1 hypothetical protein [Candidatus Hydrogenedentota bacterium]HOH42400.1 hypothetical protein [Candidatus Hydrogenedentota bacterium]HOM47925.1 hypothetical protein [Candidatus Hydrogenedentota bacterium]
MIRKLLLTLPLLLVLFGCSDFLKKTPPPPAQETAGPKNKEEAQALIRPAIEPLRKTMQPGGPGISEAERQQVLLALQHAIVTYGDNQYGKEVLRDLGYELQDLARQASAQERYRLVLICIEASNLLEVNSAYLKRAGAQATTMLQKPMVSVKGFMDDLETKQLTVFLELTDYFTGKIDRVQAREGDEFNNLRLVRVIGRNKSVLFEYLKVPGLFFEVQSFAP